MNSEIKKLESLGIKILPLDIALKFMSNKPEWDEFKPKRKYKKKK